jgi:hypothetical protein
MRTAPTTPASTPYTAASYSERNDSSYGAPSLTAWHVYSTACNWNCYGAGGWSKGQADMLQDPLLDPLTLTPAVGSPAIGAGSAAVPGVSYGCQSMPLHLCGDPPNIGAH